MPHIVDELLALDVLTLREHTERSGDAFDIDEHREKLRKSLEINEMCAVRRDGRLAAYAMLRPEAGTCWFVGAFATHPEHRTYSVVCELFAQIAALATKRGIGELRSHVYKTNRLSVAFHRKLGFMVTRENDKGFEFFTTLDDLATKPSVRRVTARVTSRLE